MTYKFQESVSRKNKDSKAHFKKLTDLSNKLDGVEERFVMGQIEHALYEKYSRKYTAQIEEIKEEIDKSDNISSNLEKCIDYALKVSANIRETWTSGNLHTKQRLQQMIFPNGIGYNKKKDRVQTERVNSFFSLIPQLSTVLEKRKNGDSIELDQISALVTPAGFKPATLRAEI